MTKRHRIGTWITLLSLLSVLVFSFFIHPGHSQAATRSAAAASVTLQVSGLTATIANGIFTIKFNSSGTGTSLVWNGQEMIGPAKGFYSSVNGSSDFAPTALTVVTNTAAMVDIAYTSSWGDLHYVVQSGVSGIYSYFIASGIGTVGEYRTLYRFNGSVFHTGYNGPQTAIAFPSLSQIQAATVLQDSTYQLSNGTIYTKYDASTYVDQDTLHGVYGSGVGAWMISPSHEYVNGGPMKQELTVHVDSNSGDAVLLNMLEGSHFGNPDVSIPSGKIYGPWFVYFNNGSISDAQSQAATQDAEWPYTWLSNAAYPLSRTAVSGTLRLADGRPAAGAMVTLAQPGGDIYTQGAGYIYSATVSSSGSFTIPHVRAGSYSLYAYAQGGSIGDVTDQLEVDNINVSGSTQSLGTLTWTPTLYTNRLWQIGTADRKADEFNLGSVPRQYNLFNEVPANLTYTVGQSTPASNWFYAQTLAGTWTVNFNLSQTFTGNAHLTVALAGSTRTADLNVGVNGSSIGSIPSFTNDAAIYRSANQSGAYHLLTFTFPASDLKIGSNSLTLQATSVSAGGGVIYDTIKLETGQLITGPTGTPTPPAPTPTPRPTTAPTPGSSSCSVNYSISTQWAGGFTAGITVTNTGTAAINGWTLSFTFPGGQQVTEGWNGTFTEQGAQVSIQNLSYNASIAPGTAVSPGFNGSWTTSNPNPTAFSLNGSACSIA